MIALAPVTDLPGLALLALAGLWCWRVSLRSGRRYEEENR